MPFLLEYRWRFRRSGLIGSKSNPRPFSLPLRGLANRCCSCPDWKKKNLKNWIENWGLFDVDNLWLCVKPVKIFSKICFKGEGTSLFYENITIAQWFSTLEAGRHTKFKCLNFAGHRTWFCIFQTLNWVKMNLLCNFWMLSLLIRLTFYKVYAMYVCNYDCNPHETSFGVHCSSLFTLQCDR